MKANTAVGFIALGASLLLTGPRQSRTRTLIARGLALLAIFIGAATVVEYVSGRSLGLDQFLFHDLHRFAATNPGRVAPQTAVLFVLLGVALYVLNTRRRVGGQLPRALNGTAFAVAVFAVIGYGYGISGLNRVATLTPIALYSAITFIVLCLGIAAADPKGVFVQLLNSDTSGLVAAKRLLPITVIVFPILGWLQIHGRSTGLFSTATGVALMVLLSTVVLFVAVLSLTKRLSQLDIQRRIGIEREARLAALVKATNDAVLSIDISGDVTSWNRAAEELFGYSEAEMLGRSIYVLTPPDWYARGRDILAAVAEGYPQVDIEIERLREDGSVLPTSLTLSRILQDGKLIGFCGVMRDITDRIRAREELESRVRERTEDLTKSRAETLQRLALAAEYRDDDTAQHTTRVGDGAEQLALRLGLPPAVARCIGQAAPLHDVGKIGVSDTLLLKPGPLTDDEFELMQQHTILGARLLAGSSSAVLQLAEEIALTHHERWNGSGYPAGLAGEAIPIAGRIVAVVDTFDAMTNDRPYHPARTANEALEEIDRCSGSLFDPEVVTAFRHQCRDLIDHAPHPVSDDRATPLRPELITDPV